MSESFGAPRGERIRSFLHPRSVRDSAAPILFLPDSVAIGTLLPSFRPASYRSSPRAAATSASGLPATTLAPACLSCASFALPAARRLRGSPRLARSVRPLLCPHPLVTSRCPWQLPHKSAVLTPQRSRSRRQMSVSAVGGGLISAMSNLMRPLAPEVRPKNSSTSCSSTTQMKRRLGDSSSNGGLGPMLTSWADGAPSSGGSWLGEARCVYRTQPAEDFAVDEIGLRSSRHAPARTSPPAARALDKCTARRPYHGRGMPARRRYLARSHALIYEAAVPRQPRSRAAGGRTIAL